MAQDSVDIYRDFCCSQSNVTQKWTWLKTRKEANKHLTNVTVYRYKFVY